MNEKLKSLPPELLLGLISIQMEASHHAHDLEQVMQIIVDGVQSLLKFDGSVIELQDGPDMVYRSVSGHLALSTLGIRVQVSSSLSGLSLKELHTMRCEDTETDDRVAREACRKIGLRSMVVVPFRTQSSVSGVLKVMSSKVSAFSEQDEKVIEVLADCLANYIHNAELAERKNSQLRLISDALDNTQNAFDIVNAKGEFIYANQAYLSMWGYDSLEEILGTSPAGHCEDPEIPLKIITELKLKGDCNIEFVAKRKDGSTFDVHMWARLAYDADGNEIFPTTSVDITDRKKYEINLKKAITARDDFLSIASHELKTPLTSLQLQNQMMMRKITKDKEPVLVEEWRSFLKRDLKQLERLGRLINDMLDISRINSGNLSIQKATFDLGSVVEDVVQITRDQFVDSGVEIHLKIEETVEGIWDQFRIEQVISNLLINAIKYGNRKPIDVLVKADQDFAYMVFSDHGIGILEKDLNRIFQRFERAVPAKEISGMGLGLHIVKEIVERHGGEVSVHSESGKGSTFTVKLPK